MNSIKAILLAGVLMAPLAAASQAADMDAPVQAVSSAPDFGAYVRGDIGAALLRWNGGNDDEGWGVGGGFGFQANEFFRTDVTLDWNGDYNVGGGKKISSLALMGNAYLDWRNDTMFTPYVGVGAGYNWVNNNADGVALSAMAGVSADLNENLAIDVGYKFRDTMNKGPDLKEHIISAGMRFKF